MSLPPYKRFGSTRFRVEERLFFGSVSRGRVERVQVYSEAALERLYLVAALALLYATTRGGHYRQRLASAALTLTGGGISYLRLDCVGFRGRAVQGDAPVPYSQLLPRPTTLFASNHRRIL